MRLPLLGHIPGFAAVPALLVVMAGAGYAVVYTTGITRTTASDVGDISLTATSRSAMAGRTTRVPLTKRFPWATGDAPVLNSHEVSDAIDSAPLPSAGLTSSRRDRNFQRITERSFMNGGIGVHPRTSSAGSGGFGSGGFGVGAFGGGVSRTVPKSKAESQAARSTVAPRRATTNTTHPSNSAGTGPVSHAPTQTSTSAANAAAPPVLAVAPAAASGSTGMGRGAAPVGAAPGPSPSPTPEPMSIFLVGAGLIGLWSARHKLG